jgi:2'-5' RNA ligase
VTVTPGGGLRRGFVALVPPPDALDHVAGAVEPLHAASPSLRWMPRAQWHLTLQFLGRVTDVDAMTVALRDAVAEVAPFPVRLGGGGAFAKARGGTVLWVGVHQGAEPVTALAGTVTGATARLGVATEDRPFRAHLTLARAARPTDLRPAVTALDAAGAGPEWSALEIVLFDSDTRATGAVHTAVASVSLRR